MRVLVLWADDLSPNLGVRALAHGTAALVTSVWPGAVVEYQNFGHGAAPMPIGRLRSLGREYVTSQHGLQRWLRTYDLVVDTRSGDSFADIYGLGRLVRMSALAQWAVAAGVPVVMAPQTLGPMNTRRGRLLARVALRRSALVMARDSTSAAYAARLGRPVDVLTSDVVFALPSPEPAPERRDVVLNVSGLLWHGGPHVDAASYRATVSSLHASLVAQGRRVSLLAHVLPHRGSPDDDVPALHALSGSLADQPEVIVPGSLEEVRQVVASADVVIGSRMHACLNALSVGTPAVPLAYSRKFAPLLEDLGWSATVDLRGDPDPVAAVLRHVSDPDLRSRAEQTRTAGQQALGAARRALGGLS